MPSDRQAQDDPSTRRRRARQFVVALLATGLIPLQFLVRYGEVPPIGWGLTLFIQAVLVLAEVGAHYSLRPEYHTPVPVFGDWGDRLGAFWLAACAFTPVLGWVLTGAFVVTADNWRLLYGLRAGLCILLPLITALPLTRYLKGPSARVGWPILIIVTLLAMLAGWWPLQDLANGPRPGLLEISADRSCRLLEPVSTDVRCQPEWGAEPRTLPILYLPSTQRIMVDLRP